MYETPDVGTYSSFENSEASMSTVKVGEKPKYASCFITMMNLLNTLVGAEILGIANSFTLCGLFVSIGLMVCTALLSYAASILVIRLQNFTGGQSINEIATKVMGKWGGTAVSVLTLCFTYSAQVAYLVIASETIEKWLLLLHADAWTTGWRRAIVVFGYAMVLPIALTIPKKMDFLNTASSIAILFLTVFACVMVYKAIVVLPKQGFNPTCESAIWGLNFFNALAIYAMIFALPAIVLPLLNPFDPSIKKRYFLMGSAFLTCFTIILVPSVCGYLMFGAYTEQIIFGSFDNKDILIQVVRATFFFVVNASFPVVGIAVVTDISALVYKVHNPADLDWKRRIICLLIADGPPLVLAMALPKVRPALEIGGAFGGCLTNFFFPPLLYIVQSKKKWYHPTNLLLLLFVTFGFVSSGIATYTAVEDCVHTFKGGV
ncbi:Transmembrane amino acid transporter protein [Trichomonas vaginalis G3]|uniref:Transmembrane amino acid transporter protein n=1 Tax=Trichomonas vaginalis (strain ATCC PRA-98 / G3) TaxID=412133 RepID=A2DL88_TRIV3|nr:amino acid transmembrane transporter protein [Trichomonas vaginalis G3]EAY18879.1 Transmembrane amino acid transporter protein [Trichomonas vaginalis G3]KAI5526002.1 amino acid transmembrane transporter protein [Trichomonas vaginalis G3]|eukprot:XP_001579865.1 Transmembrane amino acid transporter protein [Trichomonas vaginalis G3]